jgi:hypothetical protein
VSAAGNVVALAPTAAEPAVDGGGLDAAHLQEAAARRGGDPHRDPRGERERRIIARIRKCKVGEQKKPEGWRSDFKLR